MCFWALNAAVKYMVDFFKDWLEKTKLDFCTTCLAILGLYQVTICFLFKQMKKKLVVLTKEHEALFNFVENNRHICTEKEKQKVELMFFWGGRVDNNTVLSKEMANSASFPALNQDAQQID